MEKVPQEELLILGQGRINEQMVMDLIGFNRRYQNRLLRYFAKIKIQFEEEHPGLCYPGLFAEVDSISGETRPPHEQKVWSWGDCRGLGIWSYLLAKGAISDDEAVTGGRTLNLRRFYSDYCDFIYGRLLERYELNGGRLPFLVDVGTNLASDDPRNIVCAPGECEPTHVFAAAGFLQYGFMRGSEDALTLGLKFLDEAIDCGMRSANVDHITKKRLSYKGEGFIMIVMGAIIDTLKCLRHRGGVPGAHEALDGRLLADGVRIARELLAKFTNPNTGEYWEYNSQDDIPHITDSGQKICDPGHVAESCGFMAELIGLQGEGAFPPGERLVRILSFLDRHGYSASGVMFKNIDLLTQKGVFDKVDAAGVRHRTAPWWNVRECCAASIKLYQLTGRQECLDAYCRAQNATYLNYPNKRIGGLMVQTLDADTLEPLPFHPATGNIDPMHCARAREREIEALELLLHTA